MRDTVKDDGGLPVLHRAEAAGDKIAIVATEGAFSFGELAECTRRATSELLAGDSDLAGGRVAIMVPPGLRFVAAQWGTWAAGGVAVPLCLTHPEPELEHVLDDADVAAAVVSEEHRATLAPLTGPRGMRLIDADELAFSGPTVSELPPLDLDRAALILYTSGTTGKPKGVVWSHDALQAQQEILSDAWGWSDDDRALLVLPLHHVHGLVNVVACALWNGATCEMLPRFDAVETWRRLAGGDITVFMAVPTIYRRLTAVWDEADEAWRRRASAALQRVRLMVSGSAALPVPTLDAWRRLSGHTLLERYGMTEIGMALSNPYEGERIPGTVGAPLPTVEVRLVDEDGSLAAEGTSGEIEVRGRSVFREYWRRPDATREAFHDGWFRTGDEAVLVDGAYRILGRRSVDIIKTGGEKVSALEVEDVLRLHPAIADCAVIGISDPEWGERVVVAVVAAGEAPSLDDVRAFARERLAPHKLPRDLLAVDDLPRNPIGKVVKPEVRALFDR